MGGGDKISVQRNQHEMHRNLLKFFHDICPKESRQGACDFSALGGSPHG